MRFVVLAALVASSLALAQKPDDKKQYNDLAAGYKSAKLAYKAHPSPSTKHAFVVAIDKFALATMTAEFLSPRQRYPDALGYYQEAINLEPSNKEAQSNAKMIDSVYSGMIHSAKAKMATDKNAAATYDRLTAVYRRIHRPIP